VAQHPLAFWLEDTFGLAHEAGRFIRRTPISFSRGVQLLQEQTNLDSELCARSLKAVLDAGNAARTEADEPLLAFRLHQWLASGSSVFATLEHSPARLLTGEGQYRAPGGAQRLLYPLSFCRECGQEYCQVSRLSGRDHINPDGELDNVVRSRLEPRSPLLGASLDDSEGTDGYFAPEREDLWDGEQQSLPESWLEELKSGTRVKANYRRFEPVHLWAHSDGRCSQEPFEGAMEGWFQPAPFMLCLRCRTVYDLRQKRDFGKLTTLSQTGRSTATTLTTGSTISALGEENVDEDARKLLSFTDNRQDASFQAGHLNDFVQVALLRGALTKSLSETQTLGFSEIGGAIFSHLDLDPEQFMRDVSTGAGYHRALNAMIDLFQYRAFEDLRRAWRVAQPNLEQCGLLRIEYEGLSEIAADAPRWEGAPALAGVSEELRFRILQAVLDHLTIPTGHRRRLPERG